MSLPQRLKAIMDHYQLSPNSFAEKLLVQRSSLSHLFNGRNKPGWDFLEKLTSVYPEVNLDWLITGNGEMIENQKINIGDNTYQTSTSIPDLFSQLTEEKSVQRKQVHQVISSKEIKKIVILYTDGSFESYISS
jgi:hypothetical protein